MIELTTGIAFLMSSLYGAGQANALASAYTVPADIDSDLADAQEMTAEETRSFIDPNKVEAYIRKNANAPILVDIARCESTFRQFHKDGTVVRGRVDRADIGVMQINERYHGEKAIELGHDIFTVEGNLAYAEYLYDKYGSKPWSASQKCWSRPAPQGEIARK